MQINEQTIDRKNKEQREVQKAVEVKVYLEDYTNPLDVNFKKTLIDHQQIHY